MPFRPYNWFAEQAEADNGCAALGLDADGLPGRASPYWDGVPPMSFDGAGGDAGGGGTIVYRRIVNGPNRFVWLITKYDEATDTALGCANLNYDDGGRWGLIPMRHVRMLGGRVDAAWQRPRPYADAVGCPARVSAPEARLIRTPPHSLVGFDVLPPPPANGGRIPGATIEIPRGRRACGKDSDGTRLYEYCYDGVPQGGAGSGVVLDTIYQSCDARALSLAGRLNGSYAYAIRVCADDGGCALCRDRPLKRSLRRRRHSPRRHRRPAEEAATAAEAARTR